ncbi:MAG: thiazole synthase [Candidatus Fibromonas sp.]|jgi:thiazole synthase|nr:thiazole synthase [Candidatus Fibromonas sp.]
MSSLRIADRNFNSRLFLGSGKFASPKEMLLALHESESEMLTVALKRIGKNQKEDSILEALKNFKGQILPNTSGARTAKEAVFAAQMAREALYTNWVKLEIHPDQKYLLPDPIETLSAAAELVKDGFVVLPYIPADPVLCKRLEDCGVHAVMPLGSPIGSNKGLQTEAMLRIIIAQSGVPVVIDAGIGAPSHACLAMEMGASAVLVNTAIAAASNPAVMAKCFKQAVESGRMAFEAGLAEQNDNAIASSPLTEWLNN